MPKPLLIASRLAAGTLWVILLAILARNVAVRQPPRPLFLSDLQPISVTQDWGKLGVDQSVDGRPLTIGAARYPKGLGTHARSRICYAVPEGYRAFAAGVGQDAESAARGGAMGFRVEGDGRVLYESPVVAGVREPMHLRVGVSGVRELCLAVTDGGDGIHNDHADWGGARLLSDPGGR